MVTIDRRLTPIALDHNPPLNCSGRSGELNYESKH